MAFGEKDLHPYVKLIVEERGRINTTDLEEKLRSTLDLSEKDLEPLRGRNDDRFSQTVRNLVSHAKANEQGIAEKHGYLIDKTKRPAVFFAKDPRSEEHTSELQSRGHLVCRLLLEKKKKTKKPECQIQR